MKIKKIGEEHNEKWNENINFHKVTFSDTNYTEANANRKSIKFAVIGFILISAIFFIYLFFFNGNNTDRTTLNETNEILFGYESKIKELDIKEKELQLREKEVDRTDDNKH